MSPIDPDYVDVAERVRQFRGLYPDGTLQSWCEPFLMEVGDKTFIAYAAAAYRTPDDPRPGIGWAWEPVPGPTNFTRDSELQNAETSAWGRAIVALGFETKKIASADEVRNRSAGGPPGRDRATTPTEGDGMSAASPSPEPFPMSVPETKPPMAKPGQIAEMRDLLAALEMQENRRDPTWATLAREFAEEQLDIKPGRKPTEPQMHTILEYMRGFLKVPA